jgi:hypothetical protein
VEIYLLALGFSAGFAPRETNLLAQLSEFFLLLLRQESNLIRVRQIRSRLGFVLSPPPIGGSGSFCRRVRLRTFSRMRKPICRRLGDEKSHPGTTSCKAQSRRRPSHFDLIQQVPHRYATPLLNAYCEVEAHRNVRKGHPLPKAALPSRSRLPFHSRAR